jgi:ribosomal protein S18 acetylase RimI-like enzyme
LDDIDLEPMTAARFEAWLPSAIESYAHENVVSGRWSEAEAMQKSREDHAKLLPQGVNTPDHHLWSIVRTEDRQPVGILWVNLVKSPRPSAFIYNIEIDEQFRRRGYARAAMTRLETEARRLGAESIRLHVFGHNTAARPLYEQLGYVATNINMAKSLAG